MKRKYLIHISHTNEKFKIKWRPPKSEDMSEKSAFSPTPTNSCNCWIYYISSKVLIIILEQDPNLVNITPLRKGQSQQF